MCILFMLATVAMLNELTDHQVALLNNCVRLNHRRVRSLCVAVCKVPGLVLDLVVMGCCLFSELPSM